MLALWAGVAIALASEKKWDCDKAPRGTWSIGHNLRFKLNRADETEQNFKARINGAADTGEESAASIESDGWKFGRNRRDVGSLQIDELTCPGSDLAHRHLLAVHPVAGCWKLKSAGDPSARSVRFALVVEIDASELEVDLYAEVEAACR